MDTVNPQHLLAVDGMGGPQSAPLNPAKEEELERAVPASPAKTPKTPKTPAKRKPVSQAGTPTKKMRGTKIAESFDDLPEEDKMLLKWKKEGKPYSEINDEWERLTGKKPSKGLLAVRYSRLKANLSTVSSEHVPQMLVAEAEISQMIEEEYKNAVAKKWIRIAKRMEDAGAPSYAPATLEKCWKKLKPSGGCETATVAQDTPAEE